MATTLATPSGGLKSLVWVVWVLLLHLHVLLRFKVVLVVLGVLALRMGEGLVVGLRKGLRWGRRQRRRGRGGGGGGAA